MIARLTGDRANVLLPETKKAVTRRLASVLPEQSGAFNEALMELGELICLPNGAPLCEDCPLKDLCVACREGLTGELPVREKQTKRKREEKTVLLIEDGQGRIAIEKREEPGLLSGMYQLPNAGGFLDEAALAALLEGWGLQPEETAFLKNAKHVFTHIDWFMKGYAVKVAEAGGRFLWVTRQELAGQYPLPTAFKPFLK